MSPKHRRLPHLYPENTPLFITWHLHGSLPETLYPPPGKPNSGKAFVWMDRYLDTKRTGPRYLQSPDVARLVVEAIHRGENPLGHYQLYAYVVMPNHVHLLITPNIAPSRLLQSLKGSTAREANKLLSRTGQPFWQHESYDHYVRDADEFKRIKKYIEWNPVTAALCNSPEEYLWSSAAGGASSQLAASRPVSTQTKAQPPKPPASAPTLASEPTPSRPSRDSALQAESLRHKS